MNDAARTLKHTSQGSRVGTNHQQTRNSQRTAQGGHGQSPIQSRQRSEQGPNLNQSRQRSQPEPNLNQSRQRSQPDPNLNQSRQRSQPDPNLNQSRQRSQGYNNSHSRQQSQQDPNFNRSRSQPRGDEGYQSRQRSQQVNSLVDPRSRQRTQEGLRTQDRNRTAIQSPAGWSNRDDPLPSRHDHQQALTPQSQRPSQRDRASARPSQVSQANGSRRGGVPSHQGDVEDYEYDDDEEEEDEVSEEEPGVNYYPDYAPPPSSVKRKGPRVETADNYETCSCFPKRKNKNIPSMLYENITCVHTGLKGQSHAGVYRFEDNWIERDVNTAKEQNDTGKKGKKKAKTLNRPKIKYIYGYPKPVLPAVSDEEEEGGADDDYDEYDDEYMSDEEDLDGGSARSKTQSRSKNTKPVKKRKHSRKDDSGYGEEQMEDDDYDEEEDDEEEVQPELTRDEVYYPVMLPQIGHSPPPSRERSRHSGPKSQQALPPLPESPFIVANKSQKASIKPTRSAQSMHRTPESGRHSAPDIRSLPSPRQQKPITKTRRFQGVYFDPGKQIW